MRKLFLFLLVASTAVAGAHAQQKSLPKSEFAVELSSSTLDIKPGETKDVTVSLLRSKAYTKSKANLNVSSTLPEGVYINFEPSEGVIESSVVKVSVAKDAKPGNYLLILNGEMQNKRKGATLKLQIGSEESISSRN